MKILKNLIIKLKSYLEQDNVAWGLLKFSLFVNISRLKKHFPSQSKPKSIYF